jgi:ribonuclease HI
MGLVHGMCDYCREATETNLHVLRDCVVARQIWMTVVPLQNRANFFGGDLSYWFQFNLQGDLDWIADVRWAEFWANVCYYLWYWRNKEIHDENFIRPVQPVLFVLQRCREYNRANKTTRAVIERPRSTVMIRWKPPVEDWVKLNTDGACKGRTTAGCGGIIRNNRGDWLGGFAKHVGVCSAFTAELWGVLEGLNYAWSKGFKLVELDVDSMAVVKAIKTGATSSANGVSLMKSILRLLNQEWEIRITHSYREANMCADALANIGCSLDLNIMLFEECPSQVVALLAADMRGFSSPRSILL